jgi:hypothetical protein
MIKLLATFGLRGFRNREAVSLVKSQAINSFKIPVFSDYLQTVRYERLKLMATTKKLERIERVPEGIRIEVGRLASEGKSVPRIVEDIARTQNCSYLLKQLNAGLGKIAMHKLLSRKKSAMVRFSRMIKL